MIRVEEKAQSPEKQERKHFYLNPAAVFGDMREKHDSNENGDR